MLHKNVSNLPSNFPASNNSTLTLNPAGLTLVSAPASRRQDAAKPSKLIDLAVISSRRCSSFFAEAAVLVLVFGILDYCMLKGRIELAWIVGALVISVGLLGASIAMDFSAYRWIRAHP